MRSLKKKTRKNKKVFKIEEKIFGKKPVVLKNISKPQGKVLPNQKAPKKHSIKVNEVWFAS